MNKKQKLMEENKHRGFGCKTITTRQNAIGCNSKMAIISRYLEKNK